MSNQGTLTALKEAVMRAAKIREGSYDHDAARKNLHKDIVDYGQFYLTTLQEACKYACETLNMTDDSVQAVYLLLRFSWNDALTWAGDSNE